jgi:hypothetical protein
MARSKRMGVFSALDELLPGPPSSRRRLEPVPDLSAGPSFMDGLLPGPDFDENERPPVTRLEPVSESLWAARRGGPQHLGSWNPLDELAPPQPNKRVTVRLPADLVQDVREAVAAMRGADTKTTLSALAERALRAELLRLAKSRPGRRR